MMFRHKCITRNVSNLVSVDKVEELFRHNLLDYIIDWCTCESHRLIHLVEYHGDPVKLFLQITDTKMKRYIYHTVESIRSIIDQSFINDNLFGDIVFINEVTRTKIINDPNYPYGHLWQILNTEDYTDNFEKAISQIDFDSVISVMRDLLIGRKIRLNITSIDILLNKALLNNRIKDFLIFWCDFPVWDVNVVVFVFEKVGRDAVHEIIDNRSFSYYYLNFDENERLFLDEYFDSYGSLI